MRIKKNHEDEKSYISSSINWGIFYWIGFFSPILESWIIDCYQPKINSQNSLQNNGINDWNSVKYITILSLIRQFFKNDIKYQEVLIVPSLNMEVPVAEIRMMLSINLVQDVSQKKNR
ncbi:hypothetical protein CWE03_03050 [Lactobacillus johnsonii]|nr:hypothetical protein CWE03_03050 [Lactobacillus johnsonii]